MIRLGLHSSRLAPPLGACLVGVFTILSKKENKIKGMQRETLTILHADTITPMGRWSFIHAGSD
jgi:hypothetical protein